ncbi:MAG: hypothetical protein H6710_04645 [Myxococcales bacterium]|nr:hypothetical protein [Myxococcales bacterium]
MLSRRAIHRSLLALSVVLVAPGCTGDEPQWPESWERSLEVGAEVGAFLSVWGPSPDEVYAVGGNPEAGVIYRFDGASWTPEALAETPPLLNWIDGQSGDVWVVGNGGVALRQTASGWERLDTGIDTPLWGVWGAAPDDVWAVGGQVGAGADAPVLAHFDGAAWTEVAIPTLDRPSEALFKVWGTSRDHVFAVGRAGVILHYDGDTWAQQPSGVTKDLISLWGTGPDEIVAVGGRSNGVVARWDGAAWTPEVIGESAGLNGVWVDGRGRAWVCGVNGVTGLVAAGASTFTPKIVTTLVLHGAYGFDQGPHFAVGGSLDRNPPYQGVIMLRGDTP